MNKIELVTKDELEIKLYECLEQRQMPDYFLYLDHSGVRNWLALDSSDEFTVASRLTDLLRQNLPAIATHISGKFDMVSIGVGNGFTVCPFGSAHNGVRGEVYGSNLFGPFLRYLPVLTKTANKITTRCCN